MTTTALLIRAVQLIRPRLLVSVSSITVGRVFTCGMPVRIESTHPHKDCLLNKSRCTWDTFQEADLCLHATLVMLGGRSIGEAGGLRSRVGPVQGGTPGDSARRSSKPSGHSPNFPDGNSRPLEPDTGDRRPGDAAHCQRPPLVEVETSNETP